MRYPLEKNFAVSLTVAVLALAPYVVLTTADSLYQQELLRALSTSRRALEIVAGLSTAGYAFGALLGADLINRFTQRRLFFLAEAAFILGSLLAALAGNVDAVTREPRGHWAAGARRRSDRLPGPVHHGIFALCQGPRPRAGPLCWPSPRACCSS